MDPITLSLLLSAGPAIFQGIQGIRQSSQAKDMQKKLGPRVNYQIPEEAKRALGLMENLAGSRDMPGQASMQSMMDLQSQKAFGNASRAATSSQDLLGVATSLGEQGQENQLNLGIKSAQNYQDRQQALSGALGTMAGFQDKVTADKQQDWYERANAAQEMKGAGMENTLGAMQGLSSAAMGGLQMGMDNGMFGGNKMSTSFTDPSSLPGSVDFSPMSGKKLINTMMQNRQAQNVSPSMPRASQGTYAPSFGSGNRMGKNPGMWDENFPGLYSGLGDFSKPNLSRTSGGSGNNNFNSGFFNADLFNPIY